MLKTLGGFRQDAPFIALTQSILGALLRAIALARLKRQCLQCILLRIHIASTTSQTYWDNHFAATHTQQLRDAFKTQPPVDLQFQLVSIVLNNDNRSELDGTAGLV